MKKLILTGVGFLFAITLTFAQETDAEKKTREKVATLTEKLALNDEQKEAIYPIIYEKHQAKLSVKADTTLSTDEAKQQIDKAASEANARILEQLNEEQKEIYHRHLEEGKRAKENN
ncbi:MAG TPA: hypothetical protein PKA53_00500 [Sphingobacterium sp.]|nr:hypothetical protein [Sphingobacterium sp.]